MEADQVFAQNYDRWMQKNPYDQWASFLWDRLLGAEIFNGTLLDLGCKTGMMTERLASYGYDLIGVDCSSELLDQANQKQLRSDHEILYVRQDLRAFKLGQKVKAVVSVCDALNTCLKEEELLDVFQSVREHLEEGGLFFFTFRPTCYYQTCLGERTFAEQTESASFIWENHYDAAQKIQQTKGTFFVRQDMEQDFYEACHKMVRQRAYTELQMKEVLQKAGLRFVVSYDNYTDQAPSKTSTRICIAAKKP